MGHSALGAIAQKKPRQATWVPSKNRGDKNRKILTSDEIYQLRSQTQSMYSIVVVELNNNNYFLPSRFLLFNYLYAIIVVSTAL